MAQGHVAPKGPTVSVIIPAYNRAHTLERAINSVLRQTFADWEIILVDDGSTDTTEYVLANYTDPRIRVIRHEKNRGVNAAKNTGLNAVRGTWFTILDSDDEILGDDALETMLMVPGEVNPAINAITCNCLDSVTKTWTGQGLDRDGYLTWETIHTCCQGEFWGLTRTDLLRGDRLNERVRGFEEVLWSKIDKRALRYYVHHAFRIWHTEGDDRVSREHIDERAHKQQIYESFKALLGEEEFLRDLLDTSPEQYFHRMFSAGVSFIANNDRGAALDVYKRLAKRRLLHPKTLFVLLGCVMGSPLTRTVIVLRQSVYSSLHFFRMRLSELRVFPKKRGPNFEVVEERSGEAVVDSVEDKGDTAERLENESFQSEF